jgi:ACS family sodium-dependent inorganic phosphate cotransporter-like MFS transporter 5
MLKASTKINLIFKEERLYIEAHIASRNEGTELPFPPFLSIMATPAFLALVAVHFGNNWGLFTLLTEIPTYLNNIQHFSLKTVNTFTKYILLFVVW